MGVSVEVLVGGAGEGVGEVQASRRKMTNAETKIRYVIRRNMESILTEIATCKFPECLISRLFDFLAHPASQSLNSLQGMNNTTILSL
jgi:hypothetical protein